MIEGKEVEASEDFVNLRVDYPNGMVGLKLNRKEAVRKLKELNSFFCRSVLIGKENGMMFCIIKKHLLFACIENWKGEK